MRSRPERSARRGRYAILLILLLPAALSLDVVFAGQQTAASIIGQVTDESGAILPGVTVTATSPALQVPQITSITNAQGEYRLTPLPIGTYSILYELSGFQSVRQENVRLTVGFVAKLDVALKIGGVTETITVSGVAPVVDVTATATSTQLTREVLQLTPTGRLGYISILAEAPGVRTTLDVGGNQAVNPPQFRAFGQVGESWQTLEGVLTTSAKSTQSGNFIDFSAIEEARVQTVGADAEMPVRGIRLDALVKSGGDAFHGSSWWNQTSGRFQSKNIDAALAAQGIRAGGRLQTRWDISADLGGRIVRNRLWFYGGVTQNRDRSEALNSFKPDGSPATHGPHERFHTGKLTYQVTNANRLIFFEHWDRLLSRVVESSLNVNEGWETRAEQTWNGHTTKAEWQGVFGNSLVASAQQGYRSWDSVSTGENKLATLDLFTQKATGLDWGMAHENPHEYLHHTRASVSWYRPDLFAGNHEFKSGFDYVATTFNRVRLSREAIGDFDYRLVFNNGVPFGLDTTNYPVSPYNHDNYLGAYLRDQWIIARRVSVNLGIRYARDNGFVPEQCREAGPFARAECYSKVQFKIFNSVAPRVSVAYDITGDGKMAIKGGWGRFDHKRDLDPEVTGANRNLAVVTNWRWRDLNGNRLYEPGEVNLDPNGPDFIGYSSVGSSSGTADAVPNPNEKQPKQDQFSLALERQLGASVGVRITGVYARAFNSYRLQNNRRPHEVYSIPITRPDPGPDGRVGTADDPGTSFTYYEYPAALLGRQFQETMLVNPAGDINTYTSFEVAAVRALSQGWQFMSSFSASKTEESIGGGIPASNPNSEINTANRTWEWLGKLSGSYVLPADVMVSANFHHRSGNPYARTVLFTGGRTIPSIVLNVEPIGTRRTPNINLLDLRIEKRFALAQGRRLAGRVNLYNTLNANTATGIQARSGPTFLRTTAILPPRLLEFSASFEF